MIRVMTAEGKFDYVKRNQLDELIDKRKIFSFYRSCGWVVLSGYEPIRSHRYRQYTGPERRRRRSAASL